MEQVGYKKLYYSGDCGNFFELNKRWVKKIAI
jgi:hypothetical protein